MKHKIELAAEDQGISENQLTLYMIAKELADLESNKPLYRYWIYARNWNDALLPFETRLTRIRVCEGEYSFLQKLEAYHFFVLILHSDEIFPTIAGLPADYIKQFFTSYASSSRAKTLTDIEHY